ncbi:MAG: type II toxin-antitoxin system PemK/MazF family toxin [Cellulomonas sp.]|nr:type II toxin-antitoxin system PemK/MazF family toxin [Cellulomonas sp.]
MTVARIVRGDVVWASKDPTVGREQHGDRPWLVLSHDVLHRSTQILIAVPMTHTDRQWTTHVRMNPGDEPPQIAMCEQIQAMSTARVRRVEPTPYPERMVDQAHTIATMLTAPRR